MADLTVNHLRRDHRDLRSVLAGLELLLDGLDDEKRWTPERCEKFESVSEFLSARLAQLNRKECEILYPALQGLFSLQEGPVAMLCDEHKTVLGFFGELHRAGSSLSVGEEEEQNLKAFTASGRKSIEILRNHLYKEERVLFPMVTRFLTPDRDAELIKKMEAMSAEDISNTRRNGE